ncbi:dihydrodipicolinate synthase family protein [Microlunatus speluncae]|uniref:dihydrodipicolinate synthase family protein n=1 Tax=Microlunatus speluncae TaxID=2594267 RepID=UPI001375B555|nr:dihydrodipicolinate synthase family protein [Microlunatus speluncae]
MPPAFIENASGSDHDQSTGQPHGVFPPIVLPLTEDGSLDSASLERLVGRLVGAGVSGLWVNGTTGEFYALDVEGRARVVRECVKIVAGSVPIIAHVGDTATGLALDHARAAIDAGAARLSVLAPYCADFTEDELKSHFRAIAQVAGGPVFAYHLPRLAGPGLSIAAIVELAGEGVFDGGKDSSSDLVWFRQLLSSARQAGVTFHGFTGGSAVPDLGYFVGARGTMSSLANLVPAHIVAQYRAARRGDWAAVRELQEGSNDLLRGLRLARASTASATAAIYKYLLVRRGWIGSEQSTAPLSRLTDDERRQLDLNALPLIEHLETAASG